jgi:transposase
MTMIGALALDGFRGFMTIDAATSPDVFHAFVEQELLPHLRVGDVVVMDNLSAHKTSAVLKTIRNAGAEVVFLRAYSPEYNPIEKAWSKMKTMMRRLNTMTRDAFDSAVAQAMDAVTLENIEAWVRYAGYCH